MTALTALMIQERCMRWVRRGSQGTQASTVVGAPAEVSTAGRALNWRHVVCEAGRRRALAPEEHASLAHLVAGSARDHIAAMRVRNSMHDSVTKMSGHANAWLGPEWRADPRLYPQRAGHSHDNVFRFRPLSLFVAWPPPCHALCVIKENQHMEG